MIGSSEMYSMATSTSTDLHTLISMVLVYIRFKRYNILITIINGIIKCRLCTLF